MSHSYEKHTWNVGEVITKALIDRMETGIDNAVDKSGDTITYKLDFVKNSSPQQKGTVLWDETNGYGRMKIQQYAQVPTLGPDGFYKNDDPNHTVADTYSFPKKAVDAFTAYNYNIFTSKGARRGIAWFNNEDTTEGNNGILNYLEINDNAKGKVLQINSNGQPTWATGNYTLSLTGNTLSLIPGTTGGTSTVTLASGIAYSLAADNDNNKIYLSGSTGNTGFTVTKGTNETLRLNTCDIPTLQAADERYVNVNGDTMTGYLNIGNTSNPIPTSGGKSPFSVYTNGQQLELHGYTKLYRNANSDDSNSEILKVYGKAAITHSTTIGGEMVAASIVYCGTIMPTSGVTPSYSAGKLINYSYENTPSIPAFNIYPQVKVVDSDLTDDIDDTTQNRTLCAIRSRFWRIDNNNNKVQDGKNRTMYFTQSVYQDDLFTQYAFNDTIGTIQGENDSTITLKPSVGGYRGAANFYLPTNTFDQWKTNCINYYQQLYNQHKADVDTNNIIRVNYSNAYEILTTKNYFLGSQVLNVTFTADTTTIDASGITVGYDETNQKAAIETQTATYSRIPWPITFPSADYAMTITLEHASGIPFANLAIVPRSITAGGFKFSIYSSSSFSITKNTTLKFHCLAIKTIPEVLNYDSE